MVIIDANIVLRYVLNDHPDLSQKAAGIIEKQSVLLPIEAACEVIYVLQKVYHVDRKQINSFLRELIHSDLIFVEKKEIFLAALEYYKKTRLDFVDTLLWAYSTIKKQTVLTFDKELAKYMQRGWAENEVF